jgi:hypothetical protein
MKNFFGTVHHRLWLEEKGEWGPDERFWSNGQSQFLLPKDKEFDAQIAPRCSIDSSKQYAPYIYRRMALEHEVEIRHEPENVDGEEFIRAHYRIKIKFAAGKEETLYLTTGVDDMITDHPNKNVRKKAYKPVKIPPQMQKVPRDRKTKNLFRWKGTLGPEELTIEYEYEKLDLPNNFWHLSFHRFTEGVRFSLKRAEQYRYDALSIGGFPALNLTRNTFSVDTFKTDEMILPSQGYIIQWRPEHKLPRKKKTSIEGKRPKRRSTGPAA